MELDKKWLEGLIITGATQKKVKNPETGRETMKATPFERRAKSEDVLSFSESGDTVTIVLNDGKKYRVAKGDGQPEKPEKQKKPEKPEKE
jgi:hypothetical protein